MKPAGAHGDVCYMRIFFGFAAELVALVRLLVAWTIRMMLESVAPRRCACCDDTLRQNAIFCPPCAAMVIPYFGASKRTIACAHYGGAVAGAIRRMKYLGRPDLAVPLGELLRSAVRQHDLEAELVIPVPLHPRRLAERGFNQASLLAQRLCRDLGAKLSTGALHRCVHTRSQAGLSANERAHNVRAAFAVSKPALLSGKRVLLIDDVHTTGATLEACRNGLLAAGAKEVRCLVVAIADTPLQPEEPPAES